MHFNSGSLCNYLPCLRCRPHLMELQRSKGDNSNFHRFAYELIDVKMMTER